MNSKLITTLEGIRYAFTVVANSSPELAELAKHHLRATQEAIDGLAYPNPHNIPPSQIDHANH